MAKQKKAKKVKVVYRKPKKMGAANNDLLMTVVGGIAGAVGGKLAINFAVKMLPASVSPTMITWGSALVQAFGGYYLADKGAPGFMKGAGLGLAISGGLKVASNLGLPGVGRVPVMIPTRGGMVGGFRDVPRLGAVGNNNAPNPTANGGFPQPARVGKVENMTAVYAGGSY